MYVDPVDQNSIMTPTTTTSQHDDDVKEAMAALKGLLGLGGGDATLAATANKPDQTKETTTTTVPVEKQQQQQQQKSLPPKQKRNKKKQNNNNLDNDNNNINKEAKSKKQGAMAQNTNSNKKDKKGKNKKKSGPENFAWSAFQSSPDASKLPIPAFSPAINEKESVTTTNKVADTAEVAVVSESNASEGEASKLVVEGEETTTVSKTGVNLAAALAQKNDPSTLDSTQTPSSSGSLVHQQTLPAGGNFSFLTQSNFPDSASPSLNPQRPPMQMLHPQHPDAYAPMPPPPPGYITIHVQVPAVLLPGNTMIVNSPYGYPVPVVIPDGIPPHSIIPVHVPAPPHLMHPPPPYADQHRYPHPHG